MKTYQVKSTRNKQTSTDYFINCSQNAIKDHYAGFAKIEEIKRVDNAYGQVYYGNECDLLHITQVKILELARKNKCEIEYYTYLFNEIIDVECLHTDNCIYLDIDLTDSLIDNIEELVIDYRVVEPSEYNRTIYANASQTEDEKKIVVLVKPELLNW